MQALKLDTPDQTMEDEETDADQPRKKAAVGDGISAGSASPLPNRESESPPHRSKGRPTSRSERGRPASRSEKYRRPPPPENQRPQVAKKQLWTPDQDSSPVPRATLDPSNIASVAAQRSRAQILNQKGKKSQGQQAPQSRSMQQTPNQSHVPAPQPSFILSSKDPRPQYDMILQPETRPISQEQLVAEVKGIYAGLVMVEAKCIEVDNKYASLATSAASGEQPRPTNEQWQALIALHRTLLHEQHDFFLASQHPSASPALRRLAAKYVMPARMWRHGIHAFLELLRHRLPASLDHMLAFIYLAYSMMALLYETVPAFEETWIECLGDLGRYRMAIEDDDPRDKEIWTGVARHWYSKASDKNPTTGRLYHHLAILARPNALQQLYYYAKALCVVVPFASTRESILTIFDPVLNVDGSYAQYRLPPFDTAFIKAHGLLFTDRAPDKVDATIDLFLSLLDSQIGRVTKRFMEQGYHIAIANSVALLGYASKDNVMMKAISSDRGSDAHMGGTAVADECLSNPSFQQAQRLSTESTDIVLQRVGDPNVLPYMHVALVFMYHMSQFPDAMHILGLGFPWKTLAIMLNALLVSSEPSSLIEEADFPLPEKDDYIPFPEDFALRGLLWAANYFPEPWFNKKTDEDEKCRELPSMLAQRKERILWLGCQIAKSSPSIDYSGTQFSVPGMEIEPLEMRSMTFGSATTDYSTYSSPEDEDANYQSDGEAEEDTSIGQVHAAESSST